MIEFKKRPYRLCAGICLINKYKKIFVGQRIDSQSDAWQMPQGGIDADETPEQAALRELKEEIGTNKAEILTYLKMPLDYDLPLDLANKMWNAQFRGQRQYWYLMRFTGHEQDINLQTQHPEFSSYRWVDAKILPSLAVDFKKDIYQKIVTEFSEYFDD